MTDKYKRKCRDIEIGKERKRICVGDPLEKRKKVRDLVEDELVDCREALIHRIERKVDEKEIVKRSVISLPKPEEIGMSVAMGRITRVACIRRVPRKECWTVDIGIWRDRLCVFDTPDHKRYLMRIADRELTGCIRARLYTDGQSMIMYRRKGLDSADRFTVGRWVAEGRVKGVKCIYRRYGL